MPTLFHISLSSLSLSLSGVQIEGKLLSREFATELRGRLEEYKTFEDPRQYGAEFALTSDAGTAHISIIGPDGDAVSLTSTINLG